MTINQHFGVLLMAFNRFTAVMFSIKQERIWSTRNTAVAIALQWILPVIIVSPMSSTKFEYDYYIKDGVANNDSLSLKFYDKNYETAYIILGFLINLLVNVATCIMYIAVFIGALRHSKRYASVSNQLSTLSTDNSNDNSRNGARHKPTGIPQQNSRIFRRSVGTVCSQAAHHRLELRLAVSGFLVFISMFMYFLYLLLALIIGDTDFDGGVMYSIVCDVFSCINPYALLLLSKQTRVAFMRTLKCKKST
uniref:G-protein coupled receptors family 1 profile domain-containing protein n=1 Tax=Plectus sambesii TaxID=2011161 RepID=A0A914WEY4_9BILA